MSETPIKSDYIKAEGMAGRMGFRMMAIIAVDKRGRIYLPPTQEMESIAFQTKPEWKPETTISGSTQYLGVKTLWYETIFSIVYRPSTCGT
jgi:putative DNA methylase